MEGWPGSKASAGGCADRAGSVNCGGGSDDRGDGDDLFPLACGIWRDEERPSETAEGAGGRECPVAAGGVGPDAGQAHLS